MPSPSPIPGHAIAALRNRGLGNEGLYLEAKPYEGYLFARCAAPVTLVSAGNTPSATPTRRSLVDAPEAMPPAALFLRMRMT